MSMTPGASSGSTDLLPAPSSATNWTASLMTDSGKDSDLIFSFDGHQSAKIPDWVVPQNLTDQFTIATWMRHGPSPGIRAEKETLLCNSDKTGECKRLDSPCTIEILPRWPLLVTFNGRHLFTFAVCCIHHVYHIFSLGQNIHLLLFQYIKNRLQC